MVSCLRNRSERDVAAFADETRGTPGACAAHRDQPSGGRPGRVERLACTRAMRQCFDRCDGLIGLRINQRLGAEFFRAC